MPGTASTMTARHARAAPSAVQETTPSGSKDALSTTTPATRRFRLRFVLALASLSFLTCVWCLAGGARRLLTVMKRVLRVEVVTDLNLCAALQTAASPLGHTTVFAGAPIGSNHDFALQERCSVTELVSRLVARGDGEVDSDLFGGQPAVERGLRRHGAGISREWSTCRGWAAASTRKTVTSGRGFTSGWHAPTR